MIGSGMLISPEGVLPSVRSDETDGTVVGSTISTVHTRAAWNQGT